MNSLQVRQQKAQTMRKKWLKVSKACFTCRVKKIKCDGVQPCMQCKARRRPCSFSKDGTVDETQQPFDVHTANISLLKEKEDQEEQAEKCRRSVDRLPSKKRTLSVDVEDQSSNEKSKKQYALYQTSQQLEKLSMMWPGEGKEGQWLVDIDLLFNGAEETNTMSESAEPASASCLALNNNLLALFFRHRHNIFPILPKSIFYRLLEHRDPLITPLLLNSMYCNAAHYSPSDLAEADIYFRKAQTLLDTCIDTPSLSLIISLCLLSTFESNCYGSSLYLKRNKARIYRDMACRMCYDLKLHKRYSFHNTGATPDDIELRKRVYWVCYCLDKMQSLVTGKPYLLSSKDVEIDSPVVLGTDDSSEFDINICFLEHIKLMQISERVLELEIPDRQAGILRSPENEQLVLDLDGQLLYWLRSLPHHLRWTSSNVDNDIIPTQLPPNAPVAHLHLVFNFLKISVLQPIVSTSLTFSSPTSLVIQQRCASAATNLTQLACAMTDQPNFILSFTLVAEAIMAAVRVHIINCADEKVNAARHARWMFQRSLKSLKALLDHRVLDHVQDFAITIEKALTDADTGNSNSRNSSPKIHVLSPIIPRTTAPTHNNNMAVMSVDHYSNLDDRWPARTNGNHGLLSFGLVSPTPNTASAPLEKQPVSREGGIPRSHSSLSQTNNPYSHLTTSHASTTTATTPMTDVSISLMYPYSRPTSLHISTASMSTSTAWRQPAVSSSANKNYDRFLPQQRQQQHSVQNQEQQQMEMYSHIWSRTSLEHELQQFSSNHLNNSFINSTRQHIRQERQERQHFESSATPSSSAHIQPNDFNNATTTTTATTTTATTTTTTAAAAAATNAATTTTSAAAINTTENNTSTENNQMNTDSELYSLWDQQTHKNTTPQQQDALFTFQPQTTARYGLGVYASAQQHHTDVIRQHIPNLRSSNSNRPVLLNHHGQVVVAGADQNNHSMH